MISVRDDLDWILCHSYIRVNTELVLLDKV